MHPLICDQQIFFIFPLSIQLTKVSRGPISIKDWITVIETGKRNIEAFKLMKYSQKHKMKNTQYCGCTYPQIIQKHVSECKRKFQTWRVKEDKS